MEGALKLGIIPKELLLEANRQGYNYSKNDYHFILSSFHREVIIQSSGVTARKRVLYDPSSEYGGYGFGKPVLIWEVKDLTPWEQSFAERVIDCFVSPSWVVLSSLDTE